MTTKPQKASRSRIDTLLVERGLVESRQRAQAVLLAGDIRVDGERVTRPGSMIATSAKLELLKGPAYVGRGGDKLAHALERFRIDPAGWTCVDVGASTGGFTDCLLQNGARRVYAVDVGYGVLDYRLRQDEPEACDLATFDLSFIGVEKVIPAVCRSLRPGAHLVVLVKPQFQARHDEVGKKGVVKDQGVHAAVIGRVVAWAADNGLRLSNLTTSPLLGATGNREFLLHLRLDRPAPSS